MRRPFNGTPVAITKTTTMKTILGWVQSEVCSLDWALMEYMELVEDPGNSPEDRKRLMANYNMLSTAKTTITAVSTNLYSNSGIGVTLLLLGFCFANPGSNRGWPIIQNVTHITWFLLGFAKHIHILFGV